MYVYDADSEGGLQNSRALVHESLRSGVRCLAHSAACQSGSGVQGAGVVVAGAEDGRVTIWNVSAETILASASVHSNIVSALCTMGGLVLLNMSFKLCTLAASMCRFRHTD